MNETQRIEIVNALNQYGLHLNSDDFICTEHKCLLVQVTTKRGRIVLNGSYGNKLFSGPISGKAIEDFVEKFWLREKCHRTT